MNYAQTIRTASRSQRVHELCLNLKNQYQATKLWNWIDNQMDSYELWGVMLDAAWWAFDDAEDENSIRFVYDRNAWDNTLCFRLAEEHRKIERRVKRAAKMIIGGWVDCLMQRDGICVLCCDVPFDAKLAAEIFAKLRVDKIEFKYSYIFREDA